MKIFVSVRIFFRVYVMTSVSVFLGIGCFDHPSDSPQFRMVTVHLCLLRLAFVLQWIWGIEILLLMQVVGFVYSYEYKLCLTLHNNEGNYLAHTQGKRHQTNLAKRAAREAKDAPAQPQPNKRKINPRKTGD